MSVVKICGTLISVAALCICTGIHVSELYYVITYFECPHGNSICKVKIMSPPLCCWVWGTDYTSFDRSEYISNSILCYMQHVKCLLTY